jgi:hypothetical protein
MFRFIHNFREDNTLNICFVDTSRYLYEKYDLLISLSELVYLPNSIKVLKFRNTRPNSIVIKRDKELDFEVFPQNLNETVIENSIADFYSTAIFSDIMEDIFGGSIWLNRIDNIIRITLDDKDFWK